MLKNNIVHIRGLLTLLKKIYNGVFYINDTTKTDITSNINIDFENSFGTQDKTVQCPYIVLNGYLYYLSSNTLLKVGDDSGWTCISGGFDSECGFGIRNGRLYKLQNGSATQIGSATNWSFIQNHNNDSVDTICIRGGKLYIVADTYTEEIKGVGESTIEGWTCVYGDRTTPQNGLCFGLGIANGQLYYFKHSIAVKVDDNTDWSDITTNYAIRAGKLYYIYPNANKMVVLQIGEDETWESVTGKYNNYNSYAYGINRGIVYKLSGTTATKLDVQCCKGIYGAKNPIALCEVK